MTAAGAPRISTGIVAAVLLLVAVYYGTDVLAPLALAFLIISIVWPLQQRLQSRLPVLVALALTIIVTAVVCLGFWSGRTLAGRGRIALSSTLRRDGGLARRSGSLGRRFVGRAFQYWMAAACRAAGHRARHAVSLDPPDRDAWLQRTAKPSLHSYSQPLARSDQGRRPRSGVR